MSSNSGSYDQRQNTSHAKEAIWWKRVTFGILGVVAGVFLVLFAARLFVSPATISGTINFTALKPDPGDEGVVTIMYRNHRFNGDFKSTGVTTPLQDNAQFTWDQAKEGATYELMAQLTVRGKVTGTSEAVTVTAPAQAVVLPIKVTWSDLPADVVAGSTAKLGGTLAVQGYIPNNSKISVQARGKDQTEFQSIEEIDNPDMAHTWLWDGAVPLQTYQVRGILLGGDGKQVGSSDTVLAEAGETEVALKVVSGAQPPATPAPTAKPTPGPTANPSAAPTPAPTPVPPSKATISGKVFINGPIAAGSSVLMLQRKPGQADYQAFTRLTNVKQGGMDWVWKDASPGVQYDIQAALQVNEANVATGRNQVVTAPASGVDFTINTGVSMPTPTGQPVVEKCQDQPNNKWLATIKYPTVNDAQQYWIQVGASSGSSEMFNQKVNANNNQDNQRVTVTVDSGRTYYTQYAYSWCSGCTGDSNFSNFSTPFAFHCGDVPQPTPAFRGYVCNQSKGVCESTNDANAPFAPNNSGLEQCQRSCQLPQ